jgi:CspA family cold shock protein
MAEQTCSGTIKSVNPDKGFGFISRADGGRDLFFHVMDLDRSLNFYESLIDTRVKFDIAETESGPKAVNIKRAD